MEFLLFLSLHYDSTKESNFICSIDKILLTSTIYKSPIFAIYDLCLSVSLCMCVFTNHITIFTSCSEFPNGTVFYICLQLKYFHPLHIRDKFF